MASVPPNEACDDDNYGWNDSDGGGILVPADLEYGVQPWSVLFILQPEPSGEPAAPGPSFLSGIIGVNCGAEKLTKGANSASF